MAIASAGTTSVRGCIASAGAAVLPSVRGPGSAADHGRTRPCSVACRVSRERLQIRPHHIAHAADAGCLPQLVHRSPSLSPAVAQGFQGHVQAYLIAELEAVGDGLGRAVDLDSSTFDPTRFDVAGESRPRKADDAKRR